MTPRERDVDKLHHTIHYRMSLVLQDYTIAEISRASGVPTSTLWQAVRRERYSIDVLWKIAPHVNRTVAWFLEEEEAVGYQRAVREMQAKLNIMRG